ncbi:lipoprotein [Spiroplasma sp. ald]|uniref:lipoprotein n=1 Tax=Spiroplasma sp. ald TaxID=2490849 RepID=UPI0037DC2723
MKRLLSIIGAISLVGASTTSLVACNTPQEYTKEQLDKLKEKNNITTKDGILEWIAPQEKPFNKVDDKWYYVVWRENNSVNWKIDKFKNHILEYIKINKINDYEIGVSNNREENRVLFIFKENKEIVRWNYDNEVYFKSVYRWNLEENNLPDLIIDDNGNVKFNGE